MGRGKTQTISAGGEPASPNLGREERAGGALRVVDWGDQVNRKEKEGRKGRAGREEGMERRGEKRKRRVKTE